MKNSTPDRDAVAYSIVLAQLTKRMLENVRASDAEGFGRLMMAINGGAMMTLQTTWTVDCMGDTILSVTLAGDDMEIGRLVAARGITT